MSNIDKYVEEATKIFKEKFKDAEWIKMLNPEDFDVYRWHQTYGSTAGPFGGFGGQAFTSLPVTVVLDITWRCAIAWIGGRQVALLDEFNQRFYGDIINRDLKVGAKYNGYDPSYRG